MKRFVTYLLTGVLCILSLNLIGGKVYAQEDATVSECDGIKLNTNFPIIGNCIRIKGDEANPTNAFPKMMQALTKIIMSLILVVCFIMIIYAGIQRASDNPGTRKSGGAKGTIAKVAITILLLGFSGVILKLINPNFFS